MQDMEDPSSRVRKFVVRVCAIAFWGLIKLGVDQLSLLAMVLLVGIFTFRQSPLRTWVQIDKSGVSRRKWS